jgi:spore coat polysaccharide biosynthesis protein SpsF
VQQGKTEYATNINERTFPRGLDVEAFTYDSFERVVAESTTQAEREHVTPYYRENPGEFAVENISSKEVFDAKKYIDRTDLRLTLDEAADYRLLKRIYDEVEYTGILPIREAVDYVDAKGLDSLNEEIRQKRI